MQESILEPAHTQAAQPPARLTLGGQLPFPATLGIDELRALPRVELGPTQVNCFTGRPVASVDSFAGVRLIDVLEAAGFSTQPRSQLKRCVIMAVGADDYHAVFSWSELYNIGVGAGVLVLFERDGLPLSRSLGPLALISANDRQLGPRHLRCLRGIHVQKI